MFSLQQVQATYAPYAASGPQEAVTSAGERVLDGWPTPLKGYRYRFRVVGRRRDQRLRGADRPYLRDAWSRGIP